MYQNKIKEQSKLVTKRYHDYNARTDKKNRNDTFIKKNYPKPKTVTTKKSHKKSNSSYSRKFSQLKILQTEKKRSKRRKRLLYNSKNSLNKSCQKSTSFKTFQSTKLKIENLPDL